jgi:hypothetical protein
MFPKSENPFFFQKENDFDHFLSFPLRFFFKFFEPKTRHFFICFGTRKHFERKKSGSFFSDFLALFFPRKNGITSQHRFLFRLRIDDRRDDRFRHFHESRRSSSGSRLSWNVAHHVGHLRTHFLRRRALFSRKRF